MTQKSNTSEREHSSKVSFKVPESIRETMKSNKTLKNQPSIHYMVDERSNGNESVIVINGNESAVIINHYK